VSEGEAPDDSSTSQEADDLVGEGYEVSSSDESDASGSVHKLTRLQRKQLPASQGAANKKEQRTSARAPPASQDGSSESSSGSEIDQKSNEDDDYSSDSDGGGGSETESSDGNVGIGDDA
jgi:Mg-chelatase subunit ChlI